MNTNDLTNAEKNKIVFNNLKDEFKTFFNNQLNNKQDFYNNYLNLDLLQTQPPSEEFTSIQNNEYNRDIFTFLLSCVNNNFLPLSLRELNLDEKNDTRIFAEFITPPTLVFDNLVEILKKLEITVIYYKYTMGEPEDTNYNEIKVSMGENYGEFNYKDIGNLIDEHLNDILSNIHDDYHRYLIFVSLQYTRFSIEQFDTRGMFDEYKEYYNKINIMETQQPSLQGKMQEAARNMKYEDEEDIRLNYTHIICYDNVYHTQTNPGKAFMQDFIRKIDKAISDNIKNLNVKKY